MKRCNICKHEYNNKLPHYCTYCGKNLSEEIEKTDIVLFISKFLIIIGIIGIFLLTYPLVSCELSGGLNIDGTSLSIFTGNIKDDILTIIIISLPVIFVIIGIILRKYFKKLCKLNLNKK